MAVPSSKISTRQKLIIDSDPGVDDSMALFLALESDEWDIIGITTIFGNASIENSTRNALLLLEKAGRTDVPVARGHEGPLKGGKGEGGDYVMDGGHLHKEPTQKVIDKTATQFLVDKINEFPGEVSILALGPLTNVALAIKQDPSFASKVKQIVVLGGSYFELGNVNPAAEYNIYADALAADIVFTSGAKVTVIGINITNYVSFSAEDFKKVTESGGKHAKVLGEIYGSSYLVSTDGIFLHDTLAYLVFARPDLFSFKTGVVRVETRGIFEGLTLLDHGVKKWTTKNHWTEHDPINVVWTIKGDEALNYIRQELMKP
ncbi:probable uridine nucleosidase 1 [Mercurialis annua]|uniref:probable uridine nucleosidase 1 n=1 Tax=Mercurialis annua TaxID=3986 RepID=UPI00215DD5F6|nr:probable uridine nucleosidase 1 [Mercurialis annua]